MTTTEQRVRAFKNLGLELFNMAVDATKGDAHRMLGALMAALVLTCQTTSRPGHEAELMREVIRLLERHAKRLEEGTQ